MCKHLGIFYLYVAGECYFLVSEQESNQRSRHRRGAEFCAPAQKAALSYVPLPARTCQLSALYRTMITVLSSQPMAAAPQTPPCRFSSVPTLPAENRNIFCRNRSYSKVLRSSPARAGRFLRGRLCLREQATQRPLSRILLVLFLARQEKYIAPFSAVHKKYIPVLLQ